MGLYVFLFAVSFSGAFLQSGIGFGAAVIMVNLLPFLFAPAKAIVLSQCCCMVLNLYILSKTYRHIRWDVLAPLLPPALLCVTLATKVSLGIDVSLMKLFLGILFICLSLYFSFVAKNIKIKPTKTTAFLIGMVSGTFNGFFSVGGPPAILYLAPALEKCKEEYLGTSQMFFISLNSVSFVVRVLMGSLQIQDLPGITIGILGIVAGAFLGMRLTKNLNGVLLKRFVYVFIGINGLVMVLNQVF